MKPYEDKQWFFQHYVQRRMTLVAMQRMLMERHGIAISPQALYNWAKRHDLLKFKGKGRQLKTYKRIAPKSAMEQRISEMRKRNRAISRKKSGR